MLSKPETPYKPFPLFQLPIIVTTEVLLCLSPLEVINISRVTSRTKNVVKTLLPQKLRDEFKTCVKFLHGPRILVKYSNAESQTVVFRTNQQSVTAPSPNVLDDCINLVEYITDLFNTPIYFIGIDVTLFKNQHQSIIDWLFSKQDTVQNFLIRGKNVSTETFSAVWNRIRKVERCLGLDMVVEDNFQCDILFDLPELYINYSNWFNIDKLLKCDCVKLFLFLSSLRPADLNRFFRSWLLSETNARLTLLTVEIDSRDLLEQILDLPEESIDESEDNIREHAKKDEICRRELKIKRNDGKKAVLTTRFIPRLQRLDLIMRVI